MTMRLSASSLAGTARTLVAVGTVSETFMFLTTAAAAPRSGDCLPAATGVAGLGRRRRGGLGCGGRSAAGSAAAAARRPAAARLAPAAARRRPSAARCGLRGGRGLRRPRRVAGPAPLPRRGGLVRGRRRRPGCPAGSRRRTRARPGPRWTGRRGTAGTSPRPATRWCRIPPRRTRTRRRAGMSSRLTRGGVPSSSVGCVWLAAVRVAGPLRHGSTGCRVYARPAAATGCAGAPRRWDRHVAGRRYSVAPWATSSSARASLPRRPGRRRCAGAGRRRRGSCPARWRRRWWWRSRRPRRRAGRGRSRARRRPGRRPPPRAAGCGRWPGRAGRRRRRRRAGAAPAPAGRRRRRSAARRCRRRRRAQEQLARSAPRRRRPPRTAGRRRWSGRRAGAVVEVAGELVDVAEVGGARRVDCGAELAQQRHELGAQLQGDVQRRPVELGARGQVGAGLDQHADDVRLPVGDGEVQRRPAALPVALDGARRAGRGEAVHRRPDGVDVAGGDQPAQALGGHASGHADPRSRSLDGGPSGGVGRSDDVAPDGQQRAEDARRPDRNRAAAGRPARARAGPAPGTSPSWPPARRRAATCRRPGVAGIDRMIGSTTKR